MPETNQPTAGSDRIAALDVLRGFAVLGILVVNIQSFSMVSAAYLNPGANDKLAGIGYWIWAAGYLLADLKFMAIFSMLFGAGIVLMNQRAEERGARTAGRHYRRQGWLLLIGLAHAHLLWFGDILVTYALCAFVLFWFRKLSPRWLIPLGIGSLSVAAAISLLAAWSMPHWPPEDVAELAREWSPPPADLDAEIADYRAGWLQQMERRVPEALGMETVVFLLFLGWRAGGLMLIGMALFKLGVLSADRSPAFYRRLAIVGLSLGLPLVAWGIFENTRAGFAVEYSMFLGSLPNYFGSLGVSLGYVALVMLAVKSSFLPALQRRLAATGRMALTNYIAQSVICTFLFYGHGFGLFEKAARPWQLLTVAAVFGLQLLWSPWWLAKYRFGPLEWAWRSLTYWKRQPMRA